MLGSRNQSKKIYQPIFRADGPLIVNTPNFDGAFAVLSVNAAGYWPTVVYELAHETVHLLDPITGHTNWLEEGAAVEFSILMSQLLTSHAMAPASASNYSLARSMLAQLPTPTLSSIGLLRQRFGALSSITADQIEGTFPSLPEDVAIRLASPCIPR